MAKDPAVLFYTSDFLSGTFTMTNEQVGMYMRLLCLQHQKGKLSEKDMLSICKAYDVDIWSKFTNENGMFFNERMFKETERRQKFSESRRNNAKSSKNNNTSEAYAKHMETETEIVTETINRTKTEIVDENFDYWWDCYDKKRSKEKARAKWDKLNDKEKELALIVVKDYVASTPDKNFRKDPATYLHNKSFNDEIIKRNSTNAKSGSDLKSDIQQQYNGRFRNQ